jgi:hypothetical protein
MYRIVYSNQGCQDIKYEKITLQVLNAIFSEARLLPYVENSENPEQILYRYNLNIKISESMIPTLHYLEICLRNRIDEIFKNYYSPTWLLNPSKGPMLSEADLKKIAVIIEVIARKANRKLTHDDIVSQMSFGFWCSFFQKKYDPALWHRKGALKTCFPYLLRSNRKRSYIESRLLKIKETRNRIAQHEPIWDNTSSVIQIYQMCHDLIFAMSNDAMDMLKKIDRFPQVHENA